MNMFIINMDSWNKKKNNIWERLNRLLINSIMINLWSILTWDTKDGDKNIVWLFQWNRNTFKNTMKINILRFKEFRN